LLEIANLARFNRLFQCGMARIEAAIETHKDIACRRPQYINAALCLRQARRQRLLAHDCLSGSGRLNDTIDMRVRGRRDQDGSDFGMAQCLFCTARH
jgi:hypothetical protein